MFDDPTNLFNHGNTVKKDEGSERNHLILS